MCVYVCGCICVCVCLCVSACGSAGMFSTERLASCDEWNGGRLKGGIGGRVLNRGRTAMVGGEMRAGRRDRLSTGRRCAAVARGREGGAALRGEGGGRNTGRRPLTCLVLEDSRDENGKVVLGASLDAEAEAAGLLASDDDDPLLRDGRQKKMRRCVRQTS